MWRDSSLLWRLLLFCGVESLAVLLATVVFSWTHCIIMTSLIANSTECVACMHEVAQSCTSIYIYAYVCPVKRFVSLFIASISPQMTSGKSLLNIYWPSNFMLLEKSFICLDPKGSSVGGH